MPAAGIMAAIRLIFGAIPPGRVKAALRKLQSVPQAGVRGEIGNRAVGWSVAGYRVCHDFQVVSINIVAICGRSVHQELKIDTLY